MPGSALREPMILRESSALNKSSYCECKQAKTKKQTNKKYGLLGEWQGSFHKSCKETAG